MLVRPVFKQTTVVTFKDKLIHVCIYMNKTSKQLLKKKRGLSGVPEIKAVVHL